jgi:mono/diheme cytochrome c family protein
MLLASLGAPAQAQSTPDGAALFLQHCSPCHQPDGSGTVGLAPSLKGDHWARLAKERSYIPTVLINGLSGPITVNGGRFSGSMPPFGPQLDDAQVAAVANHLRKLQGAPADEAAYGVDEVKAARQQPGSPPQSRVKRAGLIGP